LRRLEIFLHLLVGKLQFCGKAIPQFDSRFGICTAPLRLRRSREGRKCGNECDPENIHDFLQEMRMLDPAVQWCGKSGKLMGRALI